MSTLDYSSNVSVNTSLAVDPTQIFGPQRDALYIVLPITIIYSLIFVTGLLGNIFTCIVIVRNKSMHTATNYYLFSLAMSDLLLLVSGMPQEMYSIWSKWPYIFGHTFCVIRGLAAETSTNASVLTITLFTIERYLAICHPFVCHQMSKLSRAMKHIILLWVVALGLALPQALQFGAREYNGVIMCLQTRVIIEHSFEISTFVFFFAPMFLISALYLLIGLKLRETRISKEKSQGVFGNSSIYAYNIRRKHSKSTKRVVKMLVAVVVTFFICWAPFHAQRLVAIYGTTEDHQAVTPILVSVYYSLTYISGVFYYMSTCINPIFYHIMSNKFRDAFKNTMMQWCCRQDDMIARKRRSYTAMAFMRNPTSSGGTVNSGNSLKGANERSIHYKSRNQDNLERSHNHNIQKYRNMSKNKTLPSPKYANNKYSCCNHKLAIHRLIPGAACEEKQQNNFSPSEAITIPIENERPPCSKIRCSYQTSLTESSILPEAIADIEDKADFSGDEPAKYLKEIKIRIIQREKEYG